ncbi:chromate resistance protein ChrB domain-containing protein [Bradyrhizobium sp. LHD-71]|uniref:chromate resistance protein ChrB domain-containing protein n=1 Tax=Bradyrhizobium sp. LHD-71 TaxID=3072141 RepID=UPI00280C5117|nr:chromate resistance protein ChrB domain-containing protein [Bradyrhizobium sp. LHD-71]MDQ8730017.1 chromate resistance protein [Bradyrhizobium sp. LHD-71]
MAPGFFISPQDLWFLTGTERVPQIVDVCRRDVHDSMRGVLPASIWHDPAAGDGWMNALDRTRPVVVACKAGHQLSQSTGALLRAGGFNACVLEGGYEAWNGARLPLVERTALEKHAPRSPSVWVTRRRPKIDRIACPWLIRRFIDANATILFVDPPEVTHVAAEIGAVPFDVEGVELSHEGPRCSFDTMLKVFGLEGEPTLDRLALIVRGADTARHDLASEAAGLHAISLGLSALAGDDDHGLLQRGFVLYDGLLAWARHAAEERHNWPAKSA